MPWTRPTLTELIERIESDLSGRLVGGSTLLRRSVLGVLARVTAGAVHMLHGFLDWSARQVFVFSAEAEYLERWAGVWGVTRKPASYATGTVEFNGEDGSTVPTGTTLKTSIGDRFRTTAEVTLSGGAGSVGATALTAGEAGNLEAGTRLTLESPISGVASAAAAGSGGIAGGADAESDGSLRARLLTRIQEPPHGGADFDYQAWALEVPGVTRAWVFRVIRAWARSA